MRIWKWILWISIPVHLAVAGVSTDGNSNIDPVLIGEQLETIQQGIGWLERDLAQKKEQLRRSGRDNGEINSDISNLEAKIARARLNFISTASQTELGVVEDKEKKKRDLVQEMQTFVEPIFDSFRRMSEKPRRIEGYRAKIYFLKDQLTTYRQALTNLDQLLQSKALPRMDRVLKDSQEQLARSTNELEIKLNATERKLNQDLKEQKSFPQVISEFIGGFVASEGKNLLIALFVFGIVFGGLLTFKRALFRSKIGQMGFRRLGSSFHIFYSVVSGLISIFSVLFTLNFLNDWFLVTLITFFLLALAWTSKTVITLFLNELKLVLNLGSVKQGERVIWQGVPWLVRKLGLQCTLENEALQGGVLLVPAGMLVKLHSRPVVASEAWFPTRVGDYVLLDDSMYGKVEVQTPETVILKSSGTKKYYSLDTFLAKNPQNFSVGFETAFEFLGKNKGSSSAIFELQAAFRKQVDQKISEYLPRGETQVPKFELGLVPFSSGLTKVWFKAEMPGKWASQRSTLDREMRACLVAIWNAL